MDNSIPKVMVANLFTLPNNMLGPFAERWAPIHAIVPHSQAIEMTVASDAVFVGERESMEQHGIFISTLMTTIAAQATLIEPCLYWPHLHTEFHRRNVEADHLARTGCPRENLPPRAVAQALKRKIADTMRSHGAAHFQIGKFYTYREGRDPAALALLAAIKHHLNPQVLINPGVLRLQGKGCT